MRLRHKPKIAFFDFACCEGCQLTVLELEERLLDLLQHVEVVAWREVMTGARDDYEIAFCEGSVTCQEDVERIKKIRQNAEILVSLGSCASIVCHNALKNQWPMEEVVELVYGPEKRGMDTLPARPITAVVPVDYQVQGCPASLSEFVKVFECILTGQEYHPPNDPVCVECKLRDNLCVLEKGTVCLGPVTRCGCDAICTTYGDACQGCRGLVDQPNVQAALDALTVEQRHSIMAAAVARNRLTEEEVLRKVSVYNDRPRKELEEK